MRKLLVLPLLLTSVLVTACGDDSTGPDADAHVGSYTLQTVNGNSLPWTFLQIGNDKAEILSGSTTLNADGTFSSRANLRYTQGGSSSTQTETATGTYVMNGSAVTFSDSDGSNYTGSLSGNTLTISDGQIVGVYTK